jgi:hypothetical protein
MDRKGKIVGVIGVGLAATAIILTTRPAKAAPGTATLSGQTIDEFGSTLGGVLVTLGTLFTLTSSNGRFFFPSVTPGTYGMSFSKLGYETLYL